jgi:hypothetical protein
MMFGRLPKEQAQVVGVRRGEKIIAWAMGASNAIVATDQALYLDEATRLTWNQITKASWEEPFLDLVIEGTATSSSIPPRIRKQIDDARDLPRAVNAKVTESVVISERIELDTGVIAQFIARRDGDAIGWSVVFEAGVDPQDPNLRASADRALTELRAALGI